MQRLHWAIVAILAGLYSFSAPAGAQQSRELILEKLACTGGVRASEETLPECERVASNPRQSTLARTSALVKLGNYYAHIDQDQRAVVYYNRAIALDPNDEYYYERRGKSHWKTKNWSAAIADYKKALLLSKTKEDRQSNEEALAEISSAKGDCKQAIVHLSNMIARGLDKDDARPWRIGAECYFRLQDYQRAISEYTAAFDKGPRDGRFLALLGRSRAYSAAGNKRQAIVDLTSAHQLQPRLWYPLKERGQLYVELGEIGAAIRDYSEAAERYAQYTEIWVRRGEAYERQGETARAIADYQTALRTPLKYDTNNARAIARDRLTALGAEIPPPPPPEEKVAQVAPAAKGAAPAAKAVAAAPAAKAPVAATTAVAAASQPTQASPTAQPAPSGRPVRRVALVLGNSRYAVSPLANPVNDATAVARALEEVGFEKVLLRQNLSLDGMRAALREFNREVSDADIALVYYAGHGIEVAGRNFLVPLDARLAKAADVDLETISLDTLLGQLDGARKLKLVILDACRNNIFPVEGAKRALSRGLARVEPEDNTLVAFAAAAGATAEDGAGSQNSPFTAALLKHLRTPALDVRLLLGKIRDEVRSATGGRQQPYHAGTLGGDEIALVPRR